MPQRSIARRLFTSVCALTHTTERAASGLGTAYFLPALFVDRFTHLGGIDKQTFSDHLAGCRSFRDDAWSGHWQEIAVSHASVADAALTRLGGPTVEQILDLDGAVDIAALGALLAPAASILSERGAVASPDAVAEFRRTSNGAGDDAAVAVDALTKVITYKFAAAWPGWTHRRLDAYWQSRRLCDVLTEALAPAMGVKVEHIDIPVPGGDVVHGTAVFPLDADNSPMLLVSNGLEGTVAEALLPIFKSRPAGVGLFVMEMPGTFAYQQPLAAEAESVYSSVIDHLAADDRVDADRIGMLGMSFGAYWSTRMAAVDPRLRAVVSNGAPTTFKLAGTIGLPEIMVWTLANTTNARNNLDLIKKLRALAIEDFYAEITAPLLVINGDTDTLVSTQDSIDIATHAPRGLLKLYPDDDHCAMGHAEEWFALSIQFLVENLAVDAVEASAIEFR